MKKSMSWQSQLRKTFGYGVIGEVDLFFPHRCAASALPPFPEFLSKLSAGYARFLKKSGAKTFEYGFIMEIDLFSLPRRAASALPPFPEFLSKLAAAEPVYAIKKA
ncbi:MAG: hypothetical protein IKB34_08375, partial [Clostridia bacterium]|nr:hypothetical protein [Clostridia bacterium]